MCMGGTVGSYVTMAGLCGYEGYSEIEREESKIRGH